MRQVAAILTFWLVSAVAMAVAGDPALPGKHPLTQAQSGELLISELRCAACHNDERRGSFPEKSAPDLTDVGARISPDYLQRFLAAPSLAHPDTTMPDLLPSKPQAERDKVAEALTHFLIDQSKSVYPAESLGQIDFQLGESLYHSVGCVACHGPRASITPPSRVNKQYDDNDDADEVHGEVSSDAEAMVVGLGHVANKYSTKSLSEFLFQPLRVRSSGRMPDMKLTPTESMAIAGYLVGEQSTHPPALVPQEPLIAAGRKHFQDLNCAACHALPGIPAAAHIGSLKNADMNRGCLSKSSDQSPRFQFDDAQVKAIQAALREEPQVDSDIVVAAKTLTAFRCIACHIRDNYGGVNEAHNPYFSTSQQNLGDDGRIPPPLTLIGAKLRPTWMKKVLFDGESVRHYMTTRMPQYGAANLQYLPDVFARIDSLKGTELKLPNSESRSESAREREKLLRAAGRDLLGDKGVNCIACHQFNGKAALTNQGIDLMTSYPRLQSGWFDSYLRIPGAFRPRTVMPTAWPDGVATFTTILDGDTALQIEAIWYYLSLGTSAADPSGIRAVNTKLSVTDRARTYRGRSRVAGFRGIAVGLPEKLNYAFNAETGTLSAIWLRDFINVNWSGQGSGDFNPASEPVTLSQDVSFVQLSDENSPWPSMPVMTKESPINPDPLYPKNLGYQFSGYNLDETSVPTFQYRSGTIAIEDRSVAIEEDGQPQLRRVLQFDSPQPQSVWFRALAGEIVCESERHYRISRLRLTIPSSTTLLRSLRDNPTQSELLLHLQLPEGKSTVEFVYEPLTQ